VVHREHPEKFPVNGQMLIDESQVASLVTVSDSIRLVREAYVRLARHRALNPERAWLSIPGGVSIFSMPAHILGEKTVSVKIARLNLARSETSIASVMATVYVYDSSTGEELARVDGETLTALRTAASTAVATDLLARRDCRTLGVIGTGRQAEAHLPAMMLARKFSRILAYSRSRTRREAFAERSRSKLSIPVEPAESSEEVVESSDVLVLATNSQVPLFKGETVRPGTHVNAVGAALPDAREVDSSLVKRSRLVVDSIAQAKSSYGDIMIPLREGAISEADLNELGDLLTHPPPDSGDGEITLFKSGGLAVLDAILANHIVGRVLKLDD
jgi:alanine dehydrogenase